MSNPIEFVGKVNLFSGRVVKAAFHVPVEFEQTLRQIVEVGWRSLPLVLALGLALGMVMTLHTRGTLMSFGASAMIPTVQALASFVEIGPLVADTNIIGNHQADHIKAKRHEQRY